MTSAARAMAPIASSLNLRLPLLSIALLLGDALADGGLGDFDVDALGDAQGKRVVLELVDAAVDAAVQKHPIADLEVVEQRLHLLALLVAGHDDEQIEAEAHDE